MADRLYTSLEADEYIVGLRMKTRIDKSILAKMAFAVSLVKNRDTVKQSLDFSGGEIKRPTFFKEDELFIRALISQVYKNSDFSEDELYSNKSIIKNHIDSGAIILWEIFERCKKEPSCWYESILKQINFKGINDTSVRSLDVFIGREVLGEKPVIVEINNTIKHANSHMAIMGKPGVGKTQFLLKILADIRLQSNFKTNFILFDYKGDVIENKTFLEVTRANTYRLLQGDQNLPINPFLLPEYNEQAIKISAREKSESFACLNPQFGIVQKGELTESIVAAYQKRAGSEKPFPDFKDILDIALENYNNAKRKNDTLIEILKDLAEFNLFWSHNNMTDPISRLSNRTIVVDLHTLPVLKELVVYLVIERLYKEIIVLPDSPIKDGRRVIRMILVIDEAHNYLPHKNIFLQKVIREGRSKGIAVFFASQSPADYQQKAFNFQELLEFTYIFQAEGVSPSAIQDLLGCNNNTARDLQVEIARLEPFQAICRGVEKSDEYIKVTTEPFFRNH